MAWIIAVLMLAGLCLTISENPWFPLPNLVGVAVFALGAHLATRMEKKGLG